MIIRELFARLGLDVDKAGFSAGDAAISGIKIGLVSMAGFATAAAIAVGEMVHSLVEATSNINDTSQAVGINTEALQKLGYAAQLSGSSFDEFAQSTVIFSRRITEASTGNEDAAKSFSNLHIKIHGAHGQLKSTEDLVGDVADAFQKMADGPKKTAAAVELFGRSGSRLVSMLNNGKRGLEEMGQEAQDLAFIIDKDTIKAGDDLGDNIDRLKALMIGLRGTIAGPLLTQINELVDQFRAWYKANKAIISQRLDQITKLISASIRGLVVVLKVLYSVLGMIIDFWQILAVLLASGVLTAITLNIAALAALTLGYLRAGAAAAFAGSRAAIAWVAAAAGPLAIAALFTLIILLVDEFITNLQGGDTILGALWPKWKAFLDDFAATSSDNDPWWITSLKGLALMLAHFDAYWDLFTGTAKAALTALGQWIADRAKEWAGYIINPLRNAFDTLQSSLGQGGHTIRNVFGGGASPAASAAASVGSGQRSVQQTNAYDIKVYQQPGQSGTDLVGELDRAISSRQDTQLEETLAAVGG